MYDLQGKRKARIAGARHRTRSLDAHKRGDAYGSFFHGLIAREADKDVRRPAAKRRKWDASIQF